MKTGSYTKRNMLDALKEAGLPCTYVTLVKMERLGVILAPHRNDNGDRIYSLREIKANVARMKKHKERK